MGKIFDALEKFSKERGAVVSNRIKDSDYEVLMQFDKATGRIDTNDPKIAKDPRILQRLKTYRLINDDGSLTSAGKAKYQQMTCKLIQDTAATAAQTVEKPPSKQKETVISGFEKVRESDWALLMTYDRQTGNLLRYDPETGELDENSRNILRDSTMVQRLIDNQMILPGGWLTPEAKRECSRLEERLQDKKLRKSTENEKTVLKEESREITEPVDLLTQTDMEVLQDYDKETLKLNMKNPAIIKNPEIARRFLENQLIDKEGKLSGKALVRCRVLAYWNSKFEGKKIALQKSRGSIGEKLKTIAEKSNPQGASVETGQKKLKIIRLGKDKVESKIEGKKQEETPKKVNNFMTALEAQTHVTKQADIPPERKFTMGRVEAKHAGKEIQKDLVTLKTPQSFEAEQFKILRTNLLFPEAQKAPRSVMVTSAMPGEGKSFVAANLAVSVARHVNWNVLLIDCDLRRPSIHRKFGFENVTGLSDYLTNGTDIRHLLHKTGIENLTVLPAGRPPDNPSELLSSQRMAALLEEAATRYVDRLIILDSPPPKMTAESGALARYVDGVILVVKYGSTPKDLVIDLINKLGKNKIIGAVINNFSGGISRYQKKYYGGEYFK